MNFYYRRVIWSASVSNGNISKVSESMFIGENNLMAAQTNKRRKLPGLVVWNICALWSKLHQVSGIKLIRQDKIDKENRDSFIVAVVDPHIITRVPSSCASLDPPPTTRKHVALTVHYTGHWETASARLVLWVTNSLRELGVGEILRHESHSSLPQPVLLPAVWVDTSLAPAVPHVGLIHVALPVPIYRVV